MTTDDNTGTEVSKSRQAAERIGRHFKLSFDNYLDHWQEWIVPMLIAALIGLASLMCCGLPHLFVVGPLTCGLYHCAFEAFKNRTVRSELLHHGMDTAGSSIPATWLIILVNILPMFFLYGVFMLFFVVFVGVMPGPRGGDPPPEVMLPMMMMMLVMYLGMFLAIFLIWVWQLWFSTRMMFVLPLITHRNLGVSAALKASWRETKTSFWELLALNLAAQMIAAMGVYFMYVGMLFTVPFAMTLITSVYLERFGDEAETTAGPDATTPLETKLSD